MPITQEEIHNAFLNNTYYEAFTKQDAALIEMTLEHFTVEYEIVQHALGFNSYSARFIVRELNNSDVNFYKLAILNSLPFDIVANAQFNYECTLFPYLPND